jgi:hypothetical protein
MIELARDHRWLYNDAKNWLVASPYAGEIGWTTSRDRSSITESQLLGETAWVIFCSGFREATVRQKFGLISFAFFDWYSAAAIVADSKNCIRIARPHFGNEKKLEAVVNTAEIIAAAGFESLKRRLLEEPLVVLQEFPFIGPVTALHLAKNLGFQFAKPDRHLQRLADVLGFEDYMDMCEGFSSITGDPVALVDTVLWRYCEQHANWVGIA